MLQSNPVYGAILYFIMRLGCRPSEAMLMKNKNIKFEKLVPVSTKSEAKICKNRYEFNFNSSDKGLRDVILRHYDP